MEYDYWNEEEYIENPGFFDNQLSQTASLATSHEIYNSQNTADMFQQASTDIESSQRITVKERELMPLGDNINEYKASEFDKGILIVPKLFGSKINVFAEMKYLNINWSLLEITKSKFFPSGVVLLQLKSAEQAKYLWEMIAESETLKVGHNKVHPRQVQIYNIPQKSTESEIIPDKVRFVRYRDSKFVLQKVAVINVGQLLLRKVLDSPNIRIRSQWFEIDASIAVPRCSKCWLSWP